MSDNCTYRVQQDMGWRPRKGPFTKGRSVLLVGCLANNTMSRLFLAGL